MTQKTEVQAGQFIWHDLMTTDTDAASTFYRHVLGWSARVVEGGAGDDVDGGEAPYWTWMPEDSPVARAGLMELSEEACEQGARPGWMGYVFTPDIDRDTKRAEKLGASVLMGPRTVASAGRMSLVQDPGGGVIHLFTPQPPESDPSDPGTTELADPSTPGSFDWNELAAADPDAAFAFYSELCGWEEARVFDMGAMGPYRILGAEGGEFGAIFKNPDSPSGSAGWLYYVLVTDLDEALRRVKDGGGEVTHGPSDVPGGRVAQCRDPQGAPFGLNEESKSE